MRTLIVVALLCGPMAFGQSAEPTKEEIEHAYRSKAGEGGTFIPGVRWETWRIKEIRGWSLKFKRISQKRSPGLMILKYQAIARKNGSCADYRITDTMPTPPANPQLKPTLVVEPSGLRPCR